MTETSIWHEVQKFEIGRNFSNKLWNACRFLYPQLEEYHFAELAGFLYRFVWDDAALSAPATWTNA